MSNNNLTNRFKNIASSTKNSINNMNNTNLIILFVSIVIIVFVLYKIGSYAYSQAHKNSSTNPVLIKNPVNARTYKKSVQVPLAHNVLGFSYSMWIYVANWSYNLNNNKIILNKGNSPQIYLTSNNNNLSVDIKTVTGGIETTTVNNFPLQKWVHVVTVLNNRTVDIYIDGKLERSKVLTAVPKLNSRDVDILAQNPHNGGYYGQLSRMQYFARIVEPEEVFEMYQNGPYYSGEYSVNFFKKGHFIEVEDKNNSSNWSL